jgi:hypothetical protein
MLYMISFCELCVVVQRPQILLLLRKRFHSFLSPKLIHLMGLQHAMDDISRLPLHPMHLYVSLNQGLYAYKGWSFSRLPQLQ